jgi:hypothetical protein
LTWSQVLTDRIPFCEYNEPTAIFCIIRGEQPKKPVFSITRGYTKELWDMSSCCWDVDPTKRPAVDHVLDTLAAAAEQWKPKHKGFPIQGDWDSTVSERESYSPAILEPENEAAVDTSGSLDPPRPLIIETSVPVSVPDLAPPSVSPPSTIRDLTLPEFTPTTSKKEGTESVPVIPPKKEKQPRPRIVIPRKETEPALVRLPKEEGCKPIPVPSSDRDARVVSVVPPNWEGKPKLAPVSPGDGVTRPAPDRRSREELRLTPAFPTKPLPTRQTTEEESKPTLAISKKEETIHAPISLSEVQPKPTPAAPRDAIKEAVPLRLIPSTPRKGDTNTTPVGLLKGVSPEPNTATRRKEAASSTTVGPRKQELLSCSTPATFLRDDRHTSFKVLDPLRSAADQWESEHSVLPILSPFDEAVGRVLVNSPSGKGEVREFAEALEKVSRENLPPAYPCVQRVNDRCWSPNGQSAKI